jgi:TPR repeat protein
VNAISKKAGSDNGRLDGKRLVNPAGGLRKLFVQFAKADVMGEKVSIVIRTPGPNSSSVLSRQHRLAKNRSSEDRSLPRLLRERVARPATGIARGYLRILALVALLFATGTGTLLADDPALAAKHENMRRFYEEQHKPAPKPPTLAEIKTAAEKGDMASQLKLAQVYDSELDYGHALAWYRKAAEQGHTNAQYLVGRIYLEGRKDTANSPHSIPPDKSEAVLWLWRAANQGHTEAQVALAGCFRDGTGVNQDMVEAFKWFALAARHTNAPAQACVQELTLKLRSEEVAAGQSRADEFVPGRDTSLPEPSYLGELKLNGISGSYRNRLAIVNNRTLGVNDETEIKLDARMVEVKCLEIHGQSVVLQVGPYRKELQFRD